MGQPVRSWQQQRVMKGEENREKGVPRDLGAQIGEPGSGRALWWLKSHTEFVLAQMLTVPAVKIFREMHNCVSKAH